MGATILPFGPEHLDAAAALLAVRHRRDRRRHPDLPPAYEDPAATLPVLQDLVAGGASGVAALTGGELAGFLLGAPHLGQPGNTFAGFMHPRSAEIDYAGHAAVPGTERALYPPLYAALAERWVAHGLLGHYLTAPIDSDATAPWLDLGFGRYIAMGIRGTEPPAPNAAAAGIPLDCRRATAADEDAVLALTTELFRSFADPPIFVPCLPETEADHRRFVAEHLADPRSPTWLAFSAGRPVALLLFEEPTSPLWHQSPLQTPPRAPYLFLACTTAEARCRGVGPALFAHAMEWARGAGYERCMVHWLTASRAAGFWQGVGFRPTTVWMRRGIDERAAWASSASRTAAPAH